MDIPDDETVDQPTSPAIDPRGREMVGHHGNETAEHPADQTKGDRGSEVVILLHGLAAAPFWMGLLSRRIRRLGFRVVNWGYPSWRRSIRQIAPGLQDLVGSLEADPSVSRVHFVAHSMGCIVTRYALCQGEGFRKLGRLVMLAPPNRGSRVATVVGSILGRWSPPLRELSMRPGSLVNTIPPLRGIEIGIIAARFDGAVPLASTRLPEAREHITVCSAHVPLVVLGGVARHVGNFLLYGTFDETAK